MRRIIASKEFTTGSEIQVCGCIKVQLDLSCIKRLTDMDIFKSNVCLGENRAKIVGLLSTEQEQMKADNLFVTEGMKVCIMYVPNAVVFMLLLLGCRTPKN